eukprot:2446829-Amphidinium_carterae.2
MIPVRCVDVRVDDCISLFVGELPTAECYLSPSVDVAIAMYSMQRSIGPKSSECSSTFLKAFVGRWVRPEGERIM